MLFLIGFYTKLFSIIMSKIVRTFPDVFVCPRNTSWLGGAHNVRAHEVAPMVASRIPEEPGKERDRRYGHISATIISRVAKSLLFLSWRLPQTNLGIDPGALGSGSG